MRNGFILLLAMAVIFFSTDVIAGSSPKGKPFVEIQGQIVEVSGAVFDLETALEELTVQVDSNTARVTGNEDAIQNLLAENAQIEEQIGALMQTAAANSADIQANLDLIENLSAELTILEQDVVSNESQIASHQAQIDNAMAFIATNVAGINSLHEDIDNNYDLIGKLQEQIDEANAAIARKADFMSASCPSGQALLSVDTETGAYACATDLASDLALSALSQDVATQITSASQAIASIRTELASLESDMFFNKTQIMDVRNQLHDFNSNLINLAQQTGADIEAQRADLQSQIADYQTQLNGLLDIGTNLQGQISNNNGRILDLQQQINDGIASSSEYGLRVITVNGTVEIPAARSQYVQDYCHRHSLFGSYHCHFHYEQTYGTGEGSVSCPEGSLPQGGGGVGSYDNGIFNISGDITADGYAVSASNQYYSPQNVYISTTCLEVYEK